MLLDRIMPYCPTDDHRARVLSSTTSSAPSLPFQLFQKFEDPQVEAAFQRYQAERGLSVVFWIMLGGISVGVLFAIESAFSNALDIPIISNVAWVVLALGLALWLKTSQQRFVRDIARRCLRWVCCASSQPYSPSD